jgi:hypothetical protein
MLNVVTLKQCFGFKELNTCISELAAGFTMERNGNRNIKVNTVMNLVIVINFHEIA